MKTHKMILSVFVVLAILGFATNTYADCLAIGQVFAWDYTGGSVIVYIWPRGNILPQYYYTFTTTNVAFLTLLQSAQATASTLAITGNAASCPTTGAFRSGGTITGFLSEAYW